MGARMEEGKRYSLGPCMERGGVPWHLGKHKINLPLYTMYIEVQSGGWSWAL